MYKKRWYGVSSCILSMALVKLNRSQTILYNLYHLQLKIILRFQYDINRHLLIPEVSQAETETLHQTPKSNTLTHSSYLGTVSNPITSHPKTSQPWNQNIARLTDLQAEPHETNKTQLGEPPNGALQKYGEYPLDRAAIGMLVRRNMHKYRHNARRGARDVSVGVGVLGDLVFGFRSLD
jgi:hypothetical protein